MYPGTEDLLSIRDGEPVDAEARAAVRADPALQAEVERLRATRERLRELPAFEPPPGVRAKVFAALETATRTHFEPASRTHRPRWLDLRRRRKAAPTRVGDEGAASAATPADAVTGAALLPSAAAATGSAATPTADCRRSSAANAARSSADAGASPACTGAAPVDAGASPAHPSAGPTDAGASAAHTSADPTDAGASPAHPSADPTDAGASPAHPSAGPTDAGASPAHPSAGPTDAGASPAHTSTGSADAGASPIDTGASAPHAATTPANAAASAAAARRRPMRRFGPRFTRSARWSLRGAIAAAVATAALLGVRSLDRSGLAGLDGPGSPVPGAPVAATVVPDPVAATAVFTSLTSESARLERLLHEIPYRPRLVNAGTATVISGLEERIGQVDQMLMYASVNGLRPDQAEALWRQRVDLMNALVQVRYAQSQPFAF